VDVSVSILMNCGPRYHPIIALRRIEYRIPRIKLLYKRLQVLRELNSINNIKSYGYRSYWVDPKTHGVNDGRE
jgi:hypothetical protein